MDFKEKVQSMTGKEIVMAMVNGLENRHVPVDMSTFGDIRDGVCYGCAATNTICEISGKKQNLIGSWLVMEESDRLGEICKDVLFISNFESAIDYLRMGEIGLYNDLARRYEFALLPIPDFGSLPYLSIENYIVQIEKYITYANSL